METVNEIKRLVIETRCTELFGGLGPEMVAVAIELVAGVQRCAPVLNRPEYAYSLIGAICSKRGMDVVGGELTVGGKKVKPEDYIPLWRQAVADRKSLHRALEEDGVELTFVARGHLDRQRAEPRRRTDDPMNGFAGWIEKFGQRMEVDADGYFTLRLAGTEDEACIDWTFISGYGDYQDKDVRNRSTMEVRLITRQKTSLSTPSADETANQAQASLFS